MRTGYAFLLAGLAFLAPAVIRALGLPGGAGLLVLWAVLGWGLTILGVRALRSRR